MKKFLLLALVTFAALGLFVSCSDSGGGDDDADINGAWTLSTVDGTPATALGVNMVMTVSDSATYAKTGKYGSNDISEKGTVTAKSDTVYTFTSSSGNAVDYTLKGDTLTGTDLDDDTTYVFVK
jgi:hypothetical protein